MWPRAISPHLSSLRISGCVVGSDRFTTAGKGGANVYRQGDPEEHPRLRQSGVRPRSAGRQLRGVDGLHRRQRLRQEHTAEGDCGRPCGQRQCASIAAELQGWIRDAASGEAAIQLEIVRRLEDDSLAETGRSPAGSFPARIILTNGGEETTLRSAISRQGSPKTYVTPDRTIWANDAKGWFSCGYGPFRRVFGAPRGRSPDGRPSTERFVTMFQEAASLAEVDQWLRSLNHKALENKAAERAQLDLLLEVLRNELMPNQIVVDRVDSDGLWLKDRNGVQLSWEE